MPFKSQAQRRFLYATNPKVAKRFSAHTPRGKKLPEKVKEGSLTGLFINRLRNPAFRQRLKYFAQGGDSEKSSRRGFIRKVVEAIANRNLDSFRRGGAKLLTDGGIVRTGVGARLAGEAGKQSTMSRRKFFTNVAAPTVVSALKTGRDVKRLASGARRAAANKSIGNVGGGITGVEGLLKGQSSRSVALDKLYGTYRNKKMSRPRKIIETVKNFPSTSIDIVNAIGSPVGVGVSNPFRLLKISSAKPTLVKTALKKRLGRLIQQSVAKRRKTYAPTDVLAHELGHLKAFDKGGLWQKAAR
tara:strand:+ start:1404 stop:2303 length:900 start_codon:yes stop_codon:yes gene_type:complete